MNFLNFNSNVLSHRLIVLTILLLSTIANYSQETNISKSELIGSWRVDETPSLNGISEEDKVMLDSSPEMGIKTKEGIVNRVLSFGPKGIFSQTYGSGRQLNGTWTLKGQMLTITSLKGNLWEQKIVQVAKDRLILEQLAKGEFHPIVPILYLTKNQ
tara:strand:- start:1046 stop:1516 length:471 start_codon:yes stop_codon:yes gene_type:complete